MAAAPVVAVKRGSVRHPYQAPDVPEPAKEKHLSAHQRSLEARTGSAVADAMYGSRDGQPAPPAPRPLVRNPDTHDTSEIILGPDGQPVIRHGVRRFDGSQSASVMSNVMTDEYMCAGDDKTTKPRLGAKDNLAGVSCEVMTPEAEFRPHVRPNHVEGLDAPYHESEMPKEARNVPPPSGKRLWGYKNQNSEFAALGEVPEEPVQEPLKVSRMGRANLSHDVTDLSQYTREELNEAPPSDPTLFGPRVCKPTDLPPRRKPTIAPIHSHAKAEHDLFGTGYGVDEPAPGHARKPASCNAAKQNIYLFEGPPQPASNAPAGEARDGLLDYFDPKYDDRADYQVPASRGKLQGGRGGRTVTLDGGHPEQQWRPAGGRGRGACRPGNNL